MSDGTDTTSVLDEAGAYDKQVDKPTFGYAVADIYAALGSYLTSSLVYEQDNNEAIEAFAKRLGGTQD